MFGLQRDVSRGGFGPVIGEEDGRLEMSDKD
jgi:hypothetical protein